MICPPEIGFPLESTAVPAIRASRVGVNTTSTPALVCPISIGEPLRFGDRWSPRIVCGRVARAIARRRDVEGIDRSKGGRHVVLPGWKPVDSILADVVGRADPAGRHQLPPALKISIPHCRDLHVADRLADLVEHTAGEDRAARQIEIDSVDPLSVADFERLPALEGTGLAVLQLNEAALGREQLVAPRRHLDDLVGTVVVRRRQATLTELRRGGAHLGLPQRLTGIGRDDAAANARRAGLGSGIARRQLRKARNTDGR